MNAYLITVVTARGKKLAHVQLHRDGKKELTELDRAINAVVRHYEVGTNSITSILCISEKAVIDNLNPDVTITT